eukprot:TRINITY_DN10130_c0_g2_i1.p1 TRINITY_DN10130_c0_g2~~TRINITY_DN10130_c0_g2_i1.p1  ORF type:complete len:239 (-),score=36.90 TRINITY_DN10130_c0_g2_i1:735-1451(-)
MQNRTDSEKSEQPAQPPMCQTNCGFFANPSCNGYCSKCYKEFFCVQQKKMLSSQDSLTSNLDPKLHPPLNSVIPTDSVLEQTPVLSSLGAVNVSESASDKLMSAPPPVAEEADDSAQQMEVDNIQLPPRNIQAIFVREEDDEVVQSQREEQLSSDQQHVSQQQLEVKKEKVQKNRNRCYACDKKVGIQGMQCKCGFIFCSRHRQPEDHNCDFDFKEQGRQNLARNNPQVTGSKMNHRV